MSANIKIIFACVQQCLYYILSLYSLCLCHHCMIELQEVLADLKMLYTTDQWALTEIELCHAQSSNRFCPRFPEPTSQYWLLHSQEGTVCCWPVCRILKQSCCWRRCESEGGGRPKRCGTSHALIWASNARQDTTFDTLQKAVILIYNNVPAFLKLNGYSINAVLRFSIIVRYPYKWIPGPPFSTVYRVL